jgi:cell division septation protein DedD
MEEKTAAEPAEFEIVLGRQQIAGTALLAMVLLAVFCGVAYSIGKSMMANTLTAAESPTVPPALAMTQAPAAMPKPPMASRQPTTASGPSSSGPQARALPQVPVMAPAPTAQIRSAGASLFGEVVPGQVYLQMGIITKGAAAIWAEGLRGHGLDAFAAPGPDDGLGMWRVLVGPLPDPKVYQQSKNTLDSLGVPNFSRVF